MEDLKRVLDRLEQTLDDVKSDLGEMKVVQAEQAADLKHHIYRTDLAEKRIMLLESATEKELDKLQAELNPLTKAYERSKGIFILVGVIGSGLGLVFAAVKSVETILSIL